MKFPQISLIEFVILGQMVTSRTAAKEIRHELDAVYGWKGGHFFTITMKMMEKGLIQGHRYAPTGGDTIRQESWYEITEAGRQHWRECYAFFSALCENWISQAAMIPVTEVPQLAKTKRPLDRREVRVATPEEAAVIVRAAPMEFGCIYMAARELGVLPLELTPVQISDYARNRRQLRLKLNGKAGGQPPTEHLVTVNSAAADWLRKAIGDRTEGYLFLTPQSLPWEEVNLRMHFSRLRRKLKLPTNVMIQNARTKTGIQLARET